MAKNQTISDLEDAINSHQELLDEVEELKGKNDETNDKYAYALQQIEILERDIEIKTATIEELEFKLSQHLED